MNDGFQFPDWKHHYYKPRPDITTYELALIIPAVVQNSPITLMDNLKELPYEAFRHFNDGDELRAIVAQWEYTRKESIRHT